MYIETQNTLSEMVLQDEVYVMLKRFTYTHKHTQAHMYTLLMDIGLESKYQSVWVLLGRGLLLWIPCREPA